MAPTQEQAKRAKAKQHSGKKAPNARVQRYLKTTEPQLREICKSTLLLKGIRCNDSMSVVLKELRSMSASSKLLTKKNQIVAFEQEGQQSLEFLATKNDCPLFALASHNKKRPNNLVLGRTFDRQILDMAELAVLYFKSMKDYGGSVPKKRVESKPLLLFVGDVWQQSSHRQLQSLLIDFYRGRVVDKLIASGLDHLIVFTATTTTQGGGSSTSNSTTAAASIRIHQRTYFCKLKKGDAGNGPDDSSSVAPVPFLQPCGPDFDFALRRTQWAEPDLYKAARFQPAAVLKKKSSKKKNLSTNVFGETIGRLHITKQNVDQRQGKKVKALRLAEKKADDEERAELERELDSEKEREGL